MAEPVRNNFSFFEKLAGSDFLRSVSVLLTGAVFAQLITFAALPLLTRVYTPADFNLLAVYMSLVGMLSVVACLGFDMAVAIPDNEEDAFYLLVISAITAILTSFAAALFLLLWEGQLFHFLGMQGLITYGWLIPAGMLFTALYGAVQYFAVRRSRFADISKTRVAQTTAASIAQLGLGAMGYSPFGLLFGQMIGGGGGVFYLCRRMFSEGTPCSLARLKLTKLTGLVYGYRRFPKFTTFELLANSSASNIPIIVIAALAAGPEAGFVALAMRVMQVPMGLLGGAVSKVYLSKAPEAHRNHELASFTEGVLAGLMKVGVGPIICIGIVAPPLFSFVFGASWGRSGEIVSWMSAWFALQFLASPISMVMHVTGRQKAMLLITSGGFLLRIGTVLAASHFLDAFLVESYALSGAVYYLTCYALFCSAAGMSTQESIRPIYQSAKMLMAWVFAGGMLRYLLS